MKFAYKFNNLLGTVHKDGDLLFTTDGNSVISPVGNKITIFDLKNNKSFTLPIGSRYNYNALDLSPNGCTLIVINEEGEAHIISLVSHTIVHRYRFKRKCHAVKFSPDGKHFAVCKENNVFVFKAPGTLTGEYNSFVMERVFHAAYDETTCLDWSGDSKILAVGSRDTNTKLYPLEKWSNFKSCTLGSHNDSVVACFFEDKSFDITTISRNGQACVWECSIDPSDLIPFTSSEKKKRRVKKDSDSEDEIDFHKIIERSEDEITKNLEKIALESENNENDEDKKSKDRMFYKRINRHYLADEVRKVNHEAVLTAAAYHKQTKILVTGFSTGAFFIHELPDMNLIHSLSISDQKITSISLNNTGDWIALGCGGLGQLLVWEWQTKINMESEDLKISPDPEVDQEPKETKKQEKDRKKTEKKMDQFLKSLANCSPEEKLDALYKKYTESQDQVRSLRSTAQTLERRLIALEKDREQIRNEQTKGILARSKLETLCRELQRINKAIKEDSMQKIREEEEKRKEVSSRFQTALNEVSVMMQQNTDKNLKLRDDNIEISNKFQKLCDQFKQREEEVTRLTKQMDLEKQLAEATVKRIECQLKAEQEIWAKEKDHYAAQLKLHEDEKITFETNIRNLEEHLSLYSNKYNDFESTIAKSNEVFDNYKVELNRMKRQIKQLELENNIWKDKWMKCNQGLTNITLEHRACQKNIIDRERKIKQLADLCRSIQDERLAYIKQLKENGIIPIFVAAEKPAVVELEKPKNIGPHKMTKKEKQLSLLKKEMQAVEKQLSDTLKSSENETNEKENALSQEDTTIHFELCAHQQELLTQFINQILTKEVKEVEVTSDTVVTSKQQEITTEKSSSSVEIVNVPEVVQKQAEDNTTEETVKSTSVNSANLDQIVVTEKNESSEKSAVAEEKSNVADLVSMLSNQKIESAQTTVAEKQNTNPVCICCQKQADFPAQVTSDDKQKAITEASKPVKNTTSNKNKSKGQKSKKNKK